MSWEKKTLGELCHIEKGKIGIKKATPGEYPLVVTAEERLSHNEYHFEGNAVIIPVVSSTGHGHASLKRIHFQSGKFAVGNILCVVMPKDESVLRADYLYRFLYLNKEKELVSRMKGMANVTLPVKEITKIEIPVPPLEKQVEFVKEYSDLEEKSNDLDEEIAQQLTLVNQLRQTFLKEAMQGELVPQDPNVEPALILLEKIKQETARLIKERKIKKPKPILPISADEIPFKIPDSWVWCRLGEIIRISSGDGLTAAQMDNDGSIPVYGGNGINGYHNEFNLEKETIVIGRVGFYCGCVHLTENKAWVTDNAFKVNYIEEFIHREFLIKLLTWADLGKQQFAGSQPVISGIRVYPKLIPIPPLSEQRQIVSKLDELMRYCDKLETSINNSQHQNEYLLRQVLKESLDSREDILAV
ncbi:MAG: restriction endonuclease subunit S [Marinoscillum sp.]